MLNVSGINHWTKIQPYVLNMRRKKKKQSSEVTIVFLHIDPSELFGVGNFRPTLQCQAFQKSFCVLLKIKVKLLRTR